MRLFALLVIALATPAGADSDYPPGLFENSPISEDRPVFWRSSAS